MLGGQANSYIYGVEYQAANLPHIIPDSMKNVGVPCSLCEAQDQHQVLMVPATTSCPKDWLMQYRGYLMAEKSGSQSSSNYICVNQKMEGVPGTVGDKNSGYVYPVEVKCGDLPCPPYEEGKELSCVVCTK